MLLMRNVLQQSLSLQTLMLQPWLESSVPVQVQKLRPAFWKLRNVIEPLGKGGDLNFNGDLLLDLSIEGQELTEEEGFLDEEFTSTSLNY